MHGTNDPDRLPAHLRHLTQSREHILTPLCEPEAPAPVWRSGPRRVGAYVFEIGSNDRRWGDHLHALLSGYETAHDEDGAREPASFVFARPSSSTEGQWQLFRPRGRPVVDANPGVLLDVVMAQLMRHALDANAGWLHLHAAAVVVRGQLVLVTGPSGSGKSIVTSALVQRGCSLLSDEVVAVTGDGAVVGHPKPITIKASGWDHIGDHLPDAPTVPGYVREWACYVAPGQLRSKEANDRSLDPPAWTAEAAPQGVIALLSGSSSETRPTGHPYPAPELSRPQAFEALLVNNFDVVRHDRAMIERLASLVANSVCVAPRGLDPEATADLLIATCAERGRGTWPPGTARVLTHPCDEVQAGPTGGPGRAIVAASGVEVVVFGDGAVLYQRSERKVLRVNGDPTLAWTALDGTNDREAAASMIAAGCPDELDHAVAFIDSLVEHGFAREVGPA